MPKLRQLPGLYLRGAMFNVTSKRLTPTEKLNVEHITNTLISSSALSSHRREFVRRLSNTIGGDYRDDKATAEDEFKVAVWRAVLYIVHHTTYTFICDACNSDQYTTGRGKSKKLDRVYDRCPNCTKVKVTNGNTVTYVAAAELPPHTKHTSPIRPIADSKKVVNYHDILNDSSQIKKLIGGFIMNYLRQILRENLVIYHAPNLIHVEGPADQIAVTEIASILLEHNIPHSYIPKANPHNGQYNINVDTAILSATMLEILMQVYLKYEALGVQFASTGQAIVVLEIKSGAQIAKTTVTNQQMVSLVDNQPRPDGEDDSSSISDQTQDRTVGDPMQEDGLIALESDDMIASIKNNLNEGAKKVLEILSQTGDAWDHYLAQAPTRAISNKQTKPSAIRPHNNEIAKALQVSPATVKDWIYDITLECLAHGIAE